MDRPYRLFEHNIQKKIDERDEIQKKTFTKWMNRYLIHTGCKVNDLYEDLRDGNKLITLLEVLTKCNPIRREKGMLRIHRLQNVNAALEFLKNVKRIRLVNIRNDDIVDGNPKLTLGLIWSIILSLQIEDIVVSNDDGVDKEGKAGLLLWAQRHLDGYDDINKVTNFTTSWRDGKVFSAIINRHRPDLIDIEALDSRTNQQNLNHAFRIAEEELGVAPLLDPEDVDLEQPDERSIITYVSALFEKLPKDIPPKPSKITYIEEYTEKREKFEICRKNLADWLKEAHDKYKDDDDVITTSSQEDIERIRHQLSEWKENELNEKEIEIRKLMEDVERLRELEEKMLGNNEELKEEQIQDVDDMMKQLQLLFKYCNEKQIKLQHQNNKLQKKRDKDEKIEKKKLEIEKFDENNFTQLFMPSSEEKIGEEIDHFKFLRTQIPSISTCSSSVGGGKLRKRVTSSYSTSSSSSSDSSDDDVTDKETSNNKQLEIIVKKLNEKFDQSLSLLEKGREVMGDLDGEYHTHETWFQLNKTRVNDVTSSSNKSDCDVSKLQTLLNDVDEQTKKAEKLFQISSNFNVIARDYDKFHHCDVTCSDYQRRASERMTQVQEKAKEIIGRYSQLRTILGSEVALQEEMEDAAKRDREICCKSAVDILCKYEGEIDNNKYLEISKIEQQIQTFKTLDCEIPIHEPTFTAMIDQVPDVNIYVTDTSRSAVMTSSLCKLLDGAETTTIQQICDRWLEAKETTKDRLKWLFVARAKLMFINGEVETHGSWLKQNIPIFEQLTIADDGVTPQKLSQSVDEMKKFKSCLDIRINQIKSNLHQNFAQFIEASARYHDDNDDDVTPPSYVMDRYTDVQDKVNALIADHEQLKKDVEEKLSENEEKLNEVKSGDVKCIQQAFRVLRHCEEELCQQIPFPTMTSQLDEYLDNLKVIQERIDANDVIFENELPSRFSPDRMDTRLIDYYDVIDGDDDVMIDTTTVEELIERWMIVRNQIQPRMKRISDGRVELEQLKTEMSTHERWLNTNETRSTIRLHVDINAKKINSMQSQREITRFKEFQTEVKERLTMTSSMDEYWKIFENNARSYDRETYRYISNINENNEDYENLLNSAAKQRYYDVYANVGKVTSRYEELLKLITGNIERLENMKENGKKRESEICKRAYSLLRHREQHLQQHCDVIDTDVNQLEQTRKLLHELGDETTICEPAFTLMTSHCPDQQTPIGDLYAPYNTVTSRDDEKAIPNDVTIDEMTSRWENNKQQTRERLKLISEAVPILKELTNKLQEHQKWLDNNDAAVTSPDDITTKNASVVRKMKDDTEKLLSEISDRLTDSGQLLQVKNNFEEKSNKFDELVNTQPPRHQSTSSSSDSSSSSSSNDDDDVTKPSRHRRKRKRKTCNPKQNLTSEVADVINRYNEMRDKTEDLHKELREQHERNVEAELNVLAACLRHLAEMDEEQSQHPTMPVTTEQIDVLIERLEKMKHDHELIDDKFTALERIYPDKNARILTNHADGGGGVIRVDGMKITPDMTSQQVLTRFEKMKEDTDERLSLANSAREYLLKLEPEVTSHISWLNKHEDEVQQQISQDDDDDDDVAESCDVISDKLQQTKELMKEVKKRLEKSRGMFQLSGEYDGVSRTYYLTSSHHEDDNVEDESKHRMQYVEKKVKEIVKKYEELSKNLVKNCKNQQEKLEIQRIQQIDDARIAEEKEKMLENWIERKEREIDGWNIESGLCEIVIQQLQYCQNLEKEMEMKKEELISLVGVVAVVGDEPHQLAQRFNTIQQTINERKDKLDELLEDAQNFEMNFSNFQSWLISAENYLNKERERTINFQQDDLQERFDDITRFEKDINEKRTNLMELEQLSSKIRYFASRQDSLGVKNRMLSLRGRWDKFVPNSNELFNLLRNLLKLLQQFNDVRSGLINWCESTGTQVTEKFGQPDSLEHNVIVEYVARHDEFVDEMKSKKVEYDEVLKMGKTLIDKCVVKNDKENIKLQIEEMKQAWRNLEDDIKMARDNVDEWAQFSSHLYSVIESLRSWLESTEKQLNSQGRICGDLQTVQYLVDEHEKKKNELTARCEMLESIKLTIEQHKKDDEWTDNEIKKLSDLWDSVADLIRIRQSKLDEAYNEASQLQDNCDDFIGRVQTIARTIEQLMTSQFPIDDFKKMEAIHEENAEELEKEKEVLFELNEQITELLERSFPQAVPLLQDLLNKLEHHYENACQLNDAMEEKMKKRKEEVERQVEKIKQFYDWLEDVGKELKEKETFHLTNDQLDKSDQLSNEDFERLYNEHEQLQHRLTNSQSQYDVITSFHVKQHPNHHKSTEMLDDTSSSSSSSSSSTADEIEAKINQLQVLWKRVWFAAFEFQKRLDDAKENRRKNLSPEEEAEERKFFEEWRLRYMKWKKSRKLRMMDLFRSVDSDQTGRLTHEQFSNNIIKSSFRTTQAEMDRVCGIFDRDGDGYIDYYEFISALYPNKLDNSTTNGDDDEYVEDEVCRQVSCCKCCKKYFVKRVEAVKNNSGLMFKYKFGDSQHMRLVRVLSSVVMVRIGGGWQALEEFLQKNDPCRAKGRTNVEIHEKMILPAGASQSMTPFKRHRDRRSVTPQESPRTTPSRHTTTGAPPRGNTSSPRHTRTSVTPLRPSFTSPRYSTTTPQSRVNNNNPNLRATISSGSVTSPSSTSSRLVTPKPRKTRTSLSATTTPRR